MFGSISLVRMKIQNETPSSWIENAELDSNYDEPHQQRCLIHISKNTPSRHNQLEFELWCIPKSKLSSSSSASARTTKYMIVYISLYIHENDAYDSYSTIRSMDGRKIENSYENAKYHNRREDFNSIRKYWKGIGKRVSIVFIISTESDYVVIRKTRLASPNTQTGYAVSKHLNFIFKAS